MNFLKECSKIISENLDEKDEQEGLAKSATKKYFEGIDIYLNPDKKNNLEK
jgi:hypothetical protein